MHHSSENIGMIAAALAQAQAELTNPEKSLVATIRPGYPRDSERTFRYAPLSSGLDIVRKSLGKHEIATVQTTSIDGESGLVRLTTVLAHSSGQWISSEWPVCPISDTSSPQRMGAALTYARRYALFTLVGIAGEDDLDAPSSDVGTKSETTVPGKRNGHSDSATRSPSILPGSGPKHDGKCLPSAGRPILESIASAKLRDQLTAELQVLSSADEATAWARRSLPSKNTLTAADARMVEAAFQLKISALTDEQSEPPEAGHNQAVSAPTLAIGIPAEEMHEPVPSAPSDGAHAIPLVCCPVVKPRRIRDKLHRQYVAAQACLICGRQPADAHHLRFAQPRAMGRKSSDEFTVPLCRIHHRELHQAGKEMAWWEGFRINPVEVAARLWARTVAARQA